ncbi:hypothetical protein GOD17_06905 [Sinorhizobium medicae]|nr:hypothetical protein [Sinorhizobium medicae]
MADNYLKYGDALSIINSYGGKNAGYLGIGRLSPIPGAVSTVGAYLEPQSDKSTQWTIWPENGGRGARFGEVVNSGDQILLINTKDENYLALFGTESVTRSGYPVATTDNPDDADKIIGAWYLLVSTPNKGNNPGLVEQNEIYLVATFGPLAGVLDTNGVGRDGFRYAVTGARLVNRDEGSGSWQVVKSLTPD